VNSGKSTPIIGYFIYTVIFDMQDFLSIEPVPGRHACSENTGCQQFLKIKNKRQNVKYILTLDNLDA
jgi:hypothetical protein